MDEMDEFKKIMLEIEKQSYTKEEIEIDGQKHIVYLPKYQIQGSTLITDNGTKYITADELKNMLLNEITQLIKKFILSKYKHLVVMTYAEYIHKKPKVHAIHLSISPFILCLYRKKPKFVP